MNLECNKNAREKDPSPCKKILYGWLKIHLAWLHICMVNELRVLISKKIK